MPKTKNVKPQNSNKSWSQEEIDYLEDSWGQMSVPTIAKKLSRSENAILIKSQRLSLGNYRDSCEYISFSKLLEILGKRMSYSWVKEKWFKKDFPKRTMKVKNKSFLCVKIDEFWDWASKNKGEVNFALLEENVLGKEPDWVKQKRKLDYVACKYKKSKWTKYEDERLTQLLDLYKYGYREISEILQRTEGAIKRRVCTLGLKQRPLKAYNHNKWKAHEVSKLVQMVQKGSPFEAIAEKIEGRSVLAIKGKLERLERDCQAMGISVEMMGGSANEL